MRVIFILLSFEALVWGSKPKSNGGRKKYLLRVNHGNKNKSYIIHTSKKGKKSLNEWEKGIDYSDTLKKGDAIMPKVYPVSPTMYGQTSSPGLTQQQTTALYTTEQKSDPELKNHRPKAKSLGEDNGEIEKGRGPLDLTKGFRPSSNAGPSHKGGPLDLTHGYTPAINEGPQLLTNEYGNKNDYILQRGRPMDLTHGFIPSEASEGPLALKNEHESVNDESKTNQGVAPIREGPYDLTEQYERPKTNETPLTIDESDKSISNISIQNLTNQYPKVHVPSNEHEEAENDLTSCLLNMDILCNGKSQNAINHQDLKEQVKGISSKLHLPGLKDMVAKLIAAYLKGCEKQKKTGKKLHKISDIVRSCPFMMESQLLSCLSGVEKMCHVKDYMFEEKTDWGFGLTMLLDLDNPSYKETLAKKIAEYLHECGLNEEENYPKIKEVVQTCPY